jgi:hypothetical protein
MSCAAGIVWRLLLSANLRFRQLHDRRNPTAVLVQVEPRARPGRAEVGQGDQIHPLCAVAKTLFFKINLCRSTALRGAIMLECAPVYAGVPSAVPAAEKDSTGRLADHGHSRSLPSKGKRPDSMAAISGLRSFDGFHDRRDRYSRFDVSPHTGRSP